MVIGTMGFGAYSVGRCSALLSLVVHWVVFELLPAVARATTVLQPAAITVGLCILSSFPACALLGLIFIKVGCATEVLPVVSVKAEITLVVFVTERAPHCLEVEHVEIGVSLHLLKDRHTELALGMREGT